MKLKVDTEPKVFELSFYSLLYDYAQSTSPRSVVRQTGLEFDHYRTYQPSDDAKLIDWVASARSNETLVRVYSENTSLNVLIMLDVSESMIYGTTSKAKIEYAIELACNVAFGVLNYGDNIGLLSFNESVIASVPYRAGLGHYGLIKEMLTRTKDYGGGINLSLALNYVMELYKQTHLVVFISDFIGYGNSLITDLHSVADKVDMLGIMVYDPTDLELGNKGQLLEIKDPYSTERQLVRTKPLAKRYKEENLKRIAKLREFFQSLGKELWLMSTEDNIEVKLPRLLADRNHMVK